jgi:hypothetical protein
MREVLAVVFAVAVGCGIAARWPRRRLFATTKPGGSVIPPGARPLPGDDVCVGLGHSELAWAERICFPWLVPWAGRGTSIVEAICGACGRPQSRLRVVYPPGYTIQLTPEDGDTRGEGVSDAA